MLREVAVLVFVFLPALSASDRLSNGKVTARFSNRGLVSLSDNDTHALWHFPKDEFTITLGGQTYRSESLEAPEREDTEGKVTYSFAAGPYQVDAVYELVQTGRFVTKRLIVTSAPKGKFRLNEVIVFRNSVSEPVRDVYVIAAGAAESRYRRLRRVSAVRSRRPCW